jgi:hypothetical protein
VSWARAVAAPGPDDSSEILEARRQELNEALERARLRAEAHFGK